MPNVSEDTYTEAERNLRSAAGYNSDEPGWDVKAWRVTLAQYCMSGRRNGRVQVIVAGVNNYLTLTQDRMLVLAQSALAETGLTVDLANIREVVELSKSQPTLETYPSALQTSATATRYDLTWTVQIRLDIELSRRFCDSRAVATWSQTV